MTILNREACSLESQPSAGYLKREVKEIDDVSEDFVPATPEEEEAVIRKLDWHLLPYVFLLYMLSVLDRSNLGNARLAGLEDAIDLSGLRYNWLGTIFYIAYICSQWTIIGWKIFPPHRYCSFAVFFWGLVATIQATASSWAALMVCRFFLAVFEAMFGPGVPLYLTFFYPRARVGFRHGVFLAGAAMANVYGGALAYGISHIKGSLAAWKLLFIIEGLPTVILAFVTWWWLPDNIHSTRFLTKREKQIASIFVARNQQADPSGKEGFQWREALLALKEPKSFIPPLFYFGVNVSFASLPLFVPTIISEIGSFTRIESNGLSSPPYLLTFITMILICWLSDRLLLKGPFIVLCTLVGAIGFILLATTTEPAPRYIGVFLAIQIFVGVPLILSWVATIHSTDSKRSGAQVLMYTVGQMGPLLGTNVFPESQKPYYRKGMWISASMCLMCCFLAILLSSILIYENNKMEKEGLIPKKGEETQQGAHNAVADEQTGVRRYRYIW